MARTSKKGLEYFPMDIDIFSDIKTRKLIKYQGGKAISIYALLLCNIYKNGYYIEWDEELPFICSELTGFDEAYVSEVIKTCLSLGLFSKELFDAEGVLTSKGIQERYSRICIQCRRVCKITDYSLLAPQAPRQPRHRAANNQTKETDKQDAPPRYETSCQRKQSGTCSGYAECSRGCNSVEPYTLTLDQEIEKLKADECWLDTLQVQHSMKIELLRNSLDDFRVQCMADGKERGHTSLQDAKQHFNSWMRIVKNKTKNDDNNKSNRRNQRRGNILSTDEKKTYGDAF